MADVRLGPRPLHVAYHERYLDWQLGEGHPTNPERARLAVEMLDALVPDRVMVDFDGRTMGEAVDAAFLVHDRRYVERLLYEGISHEFPTTGRNRGLSHAAAALFMGTVELMRRLEADHWAPGVSFNPMGAKHHAAYAAGSGFCVLNDHAWAATWAMAQGLRVAVLDWDVHHGDGTESLLWRSADAVTLSIHQGGIFPGTGLESDLDAGAWNWALMRGQGDPALERSVQGALAVMSDFKPDLLLLAAGADGLGVDPLGGLNYSLAGLYHVAGLVGDWAAARGLPVVVGGAGGYTPLRETPMAWAGVVATLVGAYQKAT